MWERLFESYSLKRQLNFGLWIVLHSDCTQIYFLIANRQENWLQQWLFQQTFIWACEYCTKIILKKIQTCPLRAKNKVWAFLIKRCDYLLAIIISIIIVNWRSPGSRLTSCLCGKMALLTWRAFNELINLSCMSSRGWSRAWRPCYLLLLSKCSMLHCSGIKAIWIQISLAIFDTVC